MIPVFLRGQILARSRRGLCLLAVAAAATGCATNADKDNPDNPFRSTPGAGPGGAPQAEAVLRQQAGQAYAKAHAALVNTDNETAIKLYTDLIARYPFTEYATQAELEKIYAQYRSFSPDEALLAADRFLREHPRHKHADYVQYLKGLINAGRSESLSDMLPIDTSKKDVSAERRAFDDFALLVQRYPKSVYAGDARQRMVFLRNRIARHELSVVRFYVKREAWVAAAKRAENLIAEFPGAPATLDALDLLKLAYTRLDLEPQLADLQRILDANAEALAQANAEPVVPRPRSRIGLPETPESAPKPTPEAPAAEPEARLERLELADAGAAAADAKPGLIDRIETQLDKLNGSYTIDAERVGDSKPRQPPGGETPTAAPAPAARRPANPAPSLISGPYVEPTVIDIGPVFGDGETPAPDAAPAVPPAAVD